MHVHALDVGAGPGPLIVGWLQGPPLAGCFSGEGAGADHPVSLELQCSSSAKRRAQRKLVAHSDVARYEALVSGGGAPRAFK